jgi:hypothetical protein
MTAENMNQSIRVIELSRKYEDWKRWSKRFLTMVTARSYLDVILPLYTKLKQETNQKIQSYVGLTLTSKE